MAAGIFVMAAGIFIMAAGFFIRKKERKKEEENPNDRWIFFFFFFPFQEIFLLWKVILEDSKWNLLESLASFFSPFFLLFLFFFFLFLQSSPGENHAGNPPLFQFATRFPVQDLDLDLLSSVGHSAGDLCFLGISFLGFSEMGTWWIFQLGFFFFF